MRNAPRLLVPTARIKNRGTMKWYFIWLMLLGVCVCVGEAIDKGPKNCADACAVAGRTMQAYGVMSGCACGPAADAKAAR